MNRTNESAVIQEMQKVLVDTYALYFKTHSYHWNVEGMHFHTLHALFEQHYTEMWEAIDEIAERLRALGVYAPINYEEITKGSSIKQDSSVPEAKEMLSNLVNGHESLVKTLKDALNVAQDNSDEVTSDVCLARLQLHEKTLWMLKSLSK